MINGTRFNVFNQIHKGLRCLQFDTILGMQQTDWSDALAAQPVISQTELLLDVFDAHAYYEDTYILAPLEPLDTRLFELFVGENQGVLQLTENLRRLLFRYRVAQFPADKLLAGNNLFYELNNFVAFNLSLMNREEQLLNPLLWASFSDEDIRQMERNICHDVPADKMTIYIKWMVKGMNDPELAEWMEAVQTEFSPAIHQEICRACCEYLSPERYDRLVKENKCEAA